MTYDTSLLLDTLALGGLLVFWFSLHPSNVIMKRF